VGNTFEQITRVHTISQSAHSHGLVHNGNSFASPTAAAFQRQIEAWQVGGGVGAGGGVADRTEASGWQVRSGKRVSSFN